MLAAANIITGGLTAGEHITSVARAPVEARLRPSQGRLRHRVGHDAGEAGRRHRPPDLCVVVVVVAHGPGAKAGGGDGDQEWGHDGADASGRPAGERASTSKALRTIGLEDGWIPVVLSTMLAHVSIEPDCLGIEVQMGCVPPVNLRAQ